MLLLQNCKTSYKALKNIYITDYNPKNQRLDPPMEG